MPTLKDFFSLIRQMAEAEYMTSAGRVNLVGMVLAAVIAILLASLSPLFDGLVKLFHPNASIGVPLLPMIVMFFVLVITCTLMLAYLEGLSRDRIHRGRVTESGEASAFETGNENGSSESSDDDTGRFWPKVKNFASGTSAIIMLLATIVIAIFTVLLWMLASKLPRYS